MRSDVIKRHIMVCKGKKNLNNRFKCVFCHKWILKKNIARHYNKVHNRTYLDRRKWSTLALADTKKTLKILDPCY